MTDKVKQMAPIIWDEIEKANNILLHCHPSPDGDSLGSSLAMMHMLKAIGKKVTVIAGDSEKPEFLSPLPGFNEIKDVDYFSINPELFDLFLILDSNRIDRVSKKGPVVFPGNMRTVNIDHHKDNREFANVTLVDISYPATCQILFDLFSFWKVTMTQEIVKCLFVGIYTDTGGFKYPPTSFETYETAAKLVKIEPEFSKLIADIDNSNSPKYLEYIGVSLSAIETYFQGRVAVSWLPYSTFQKYGFSEKSISKSEISTMMRTVRNWEISICATEIVDGELGLSMRSKDGIKFDLSKLATMIGGGGHPVAAGAKIDKPFEEAKKFLLDSIKEVFPELGQP